VTATKDFRYGTRRLKAGDEFDARESDARLLVAIGKAQYRTRTMTPDRAYATKQIVTQPVKPEDKPPEKVSTYVPPVREFKRRDAK
jgi:hypothetical protein